MLRSEQNKYSIFKNTIMATTSPQLQIDFPLFILPHQLTADLIERVVRLHRQYYEKTAVCNSQFEVSLIPEGKLSAMITEFVPDSASGASDGLHQLGPKVFTLIQSSKNYKAVYQKKAKSQEKFRQYCVKIVLENIAIGQLSQVKSNDLVRLEILIVAPTTSDLIEAFTASKNKIVGLLRAKVGDEINISNQSAGMTQAQNIIKKQAPKQVNIKAIEKSKVYLFGYRDPKKGVFLVGINNGVFIQSSVAQIMYAEELIFFPALGDGSVRLYRYAVPRIL